MRFVISFVLACATILATFMLQLCDDSQTSNGSIVSAVSFFAILAALYFVDYKKKFSISVKTCNVLILIAVALQVGALFQSREDFLAFSIANILSSLPTILFFQRKTLRKSYQILSITFVEVAVGCVFQRSALFIAALPIYAVLAFISLSLLFQWGERKFYAERIVLKNRFIGNKNLIMITEEEKDEIVDVKRLDVYENKVAYRYGRTATESKETRFFRRPIAPPLYFNVEFFRRFIINALGACLFAALFFCLFPRLDQIGFGAIQFEPVSWESRSGARATKTGFKTSIELGDLGPTVDSHSPVLTIEFNDLFPNSSTALDPNHPIYLRGMVLANYSNRVWSNVVTSNPFENVRELSQSLERVTTTKLNDLFPDDLINGDVRVPSYTPDPSTPYHFTAPGSPQAFQTRLFNPRLTRQPFFRQPPTSLPSLIAFNDEPDEIEKRLLAYCKNNKEKLLYDARSQLINLKVELNQLDVPLVFCIYPFYVVKNSVTLGTTRGLGVQLDVQSKDYKNKNSFWFLTTAFRDGRQAELTPNQELTLPYIDQYLAIDAERFPRLIEKAKAWDAESNVPREDFVSRARYLESRLRDYGEYKYSRTGAMRNQNLDPLEDFISEHKEGHCEYFAGALALMLRAVGIPSRVVVGYATNISTESSKTTVRQSDAHSWVEAYIPETKLPTSESQSAEIFPGSALQKDGSNCLVSVTSEWVKDGGWLRLDATPAADRNAERPSLLVVGIYNWSNFFRSFGNDFILNFNGAKQMQNVYRPIVNLCASLVSDVKEFMKNFGFIRVFLRRCRDVVKKFVSGEWTPEVVARFLFLFAFGFASIYFGWRWSVKLSAKLRRTLKDAQEAKRKRAALMGFDEQATLLYQRVERAFERRLNTARIPSETPLEFLSRCFLLEDERDVNSRQKENAPSDSDVSKVDRAQKTSRRSGVETTNATFVPTEPQTRAKLRELINRYYRAQFGGVAMTDDETQRWNGFLKEAQIA